MRYFIIIFVSFVFFISIYQDIPKARCDQITINQDLSETTLQTKTVDPKKKELWNSIPENVCSKIISEELKIHPEVIEKENEIIEKYIKLFGQKVGKQVGLSTALTYRIDWVNTYIVNRHECVIWGHVDKEFEKRDKTVIKTGDYLALYKLSGKDAALFWGPVAATDQDHVKAEMSPGSKYKKCSKVLDLSRNEYVTARPT